MENEAQVPNPNPTPPPPPAPARTQGLSRPRKWFRRFGCCLLLIVWFVLMLMPCFFVTLLVEKDIVISRSSVPDHEWRVFILEEPDERGFGFTSGKIVSGGSDEETVCVVTSVDYLLWEGESEPDTYCNCFERVGEGWSTTLAGGDADCNPREFEFDEDQ